MIGHLTMGYDPASHDGDVSSLAFRKGGELLAVLTGEALPQFCEYHGLNQNTVRTWRRKSNPVSPQVEVFDAILQKMGYRLVIERKRQ